MQSSGKSGKTALKSTLFLALRFALQLVNKTVFCHNIDARTGKLVQLCCLVQIAEPAGIICHGKKGDHVQNLF